MTVKKEYMCTETNVTVINVALQMNRFSHNRIFSLFNMFYSKLSVLWVFGGNNTQISRLITSNSICIAMIKHTDSYHIEQLHQ